MKYYDYVRKKVEFKFIYIGKHFVNEISPNNWAVELKQSVHYYLHNESSEIDFSFKHLNYSLKINKFEKISLTYYLNSEVVGSPGWRLTLNSNNSEIAHLIYLPNPNSLVEAIILSDKFFKLKKNQDSLCSKKILNNHYDYLYNHTKGFSLDY
ncbi:MAG: hypothetical protein JJU13_12555 [Balneolaceae bacterium]|nr:hypothetical protein [Balneolaceae bacterium]